MPLLFWIGLILLVSISACRKIEPDPYEPPYLDPCDAVPIVTLDTILPDPDNELRYTFQVDAPTIVMVRVVAVDALTQDSLYSGWYSGAEDLLIPMALFAEEAHYGIHLEFGYEPCWFRFFGDSLIIPELPANLPDYSLTKSGYSGYEGYFLLNQPFLPGTIFLLDTRSRIVWYEEMPERPIAYNLSPRGTFLMIFHQGGFREVDLFGNYLRDWPLGYSGLQYETHHEVIEEDNENLLVLTYVDSIYDLSASGGPSSALVHGNGMQILDPSGNLVWDWTMFEVEDPLNDTAIAYTYSDWGHANSIQRTRDGHFIISFRDLDQVWKINSQTGELIWKLGAGGDFVLGPDARFYRQHDARFIGKNRMLIYDNGITLYRETTRALALDIDEQAMTATVAWEAELPADLWSEIMGNASVLADGNVLMSSPMHNAVVITSKTGEILWRAEGNYRPYRAEPVQVFNP